MQILSYFVQYLSIFGTLFSLHLTYQVKLWDTRQPNAMATIALSDRAFCMDAKDNVVVRLWTYDTVSI